MIFAGKGPLGAILAGLVLLYCASLPGPWFTNDEATEVIPSWVMRLLAFVAAMWFFYRAVWALATIGGEAGSTDEAMSARANRRFRWRMISAILLAAVSLHAQQVLLQSIVAPSTVVIQNGQPVNFAVHGFIEFKSLAELFPYIDSQKQRWKGILNEAERRNLARQLLREGIESRIVSMTDERPLETLMTHTSDELRQALAQVKEPVPPGYADAFLQVQQKWKHSLNCWSASPDIRGRVLSNWYPIEEGIPLYGATYDSTEHFWQAVKYHPDLTVADLIELLGVLEHKDWAPWLARLDQDPRLYLPNAYAVEFLRHNLTLERVHWFRDELNRQGVKPGELARAAQQRGTKSFRFSAYEEKILWGDLADVFHLVYTFSSPDDPIRSTLAARHFDWIYLNHRQLGFIGEDFHSLMLEVFRVKYLQIPRFREVISSIPMEIRIEHFLNDGDSPDIPIPVYVGYLNQIRELARRQQP